MPVSPLVPGPPLTRVPVLETPRMLLRGHQPADLSEYAAMWADPAFFRYLGGKPLSEEEVWRKMLAQQGHWLLLGYGFWAVEEKSTGRFIGCVGFSDYNRDLTPSIKGIPEIGWVLVPRLHGQGYATEAIRAALAWGVAHFRTPQTVCIIDPDNVASLGVARKFGYQELARPMYKGHPIVLLSR
ncbi:MAG: GNAT family N-acetyltransferase [Hymenobacter sp.]|nr:GNAT family N-acetyltransferase [Hymenobacter sp.]